MRAADTMEHCLLKGQALGVGQFPVLEGDRVVGMISAAEILQLAAQFLGAWEKWSGVTLAPTELGPGVLGRIAAAVEAAGATLHALYPIGRNDVPDATDRPRKRVIVRCVTRDIGAVAQALEAAGFAVLETSAEVQSPPCAARPRTAGGAGEPGSDTHGARGLRRARKPRERWRSSAARRRARQASAAPSRRPAR
ncbi:MAG: hypothetical protein M5U08_26195 [Burkholderiales bacterium]|nr:hypothetical protein [Burkholderiales bacterium]